MTIRRLLPVMLFLAACGDDAPKTPDAPVTPDMAVDMPGATCDAAIAGTIAVPGMYSGTVLGGGSDHNVAMGVCATETEDLWFEPKGEDVVVSLTGLTPGSTYLVTLETGADDVSFYVVDACPPASGAITSGCSNFTDAFVTDPENGVFVATAAEQYIIVDNPEDAPLTTGAFTLSVATAQCTPETEDTACSGGTPVCVDFQCVQCATSFDCTAANPVCGATNVCEAGPAMCTGDDAGDTAPGDDGPTSARTLAIPSAATPTVQTASVCNTPANEADWFKFTVATPAAFGVELTFTGAANDLDVRVRDSAGALVASGTSNAGINEGIRTPVLPAGDYYVIVNQFEPTATLAAVPYTLTLSLAECTDDFECIGDAGGPVCGPTGSCRASLVACTLDDLADTVGNGDDGPGGARLLVSGVPSTGANSICGLAGESDFYRIAVTNSQGIDVAVSWTDAAADLDVAVLDATGATLGTTFWQSPESVKVTHLATGTYYIAVTKFEGTPTATVTPYTITATQTAAQACTVAGDGTSAACATDYSTQAYRAVCTPATGVCSFKPAGAGAEGVFCDSGDDCTSARCSYLPFEADANKSVCTKTCVAAGDCATLTGTTCTTGFTNNFCVPSCTAPVDCGANPNSATVDTGLPWDYLTCTAGVCGL